MKGIPRCVLPSGRQRHSSRRAPKAVQSSHKNLPSAASLPGPPFTLMLAQKHPQPDPCEAASHFLTEAESGLGKGVEKGKVTRSPADFFTLKPQQKCLRCIHGSAAERPLKSMCRLTPGVARARFNSVPEPLHHLQQVQSFGQEVNYVKTQWIRFICIIIYKVEDFISL